MFRDIYTFDVVSSIKRGLAVNCIDRLKGENFFCNGMVVTDLINLIIDAENDKTNRYQFYVYEKEKGATNDSETAES